jgi:hypothetical protein
VRLCNNYINFRMPPSLVNDIMLDRDTSNMLAATGGHLIYDEESTGDFGTDVDSEHEERLKKLMNADASKPLMSADLELLTNINLGAKGGHSSLAGFGDPVIILDDVLEHVTDMRTL